MLNALGGSGERSIVSQEPRRSKEEKEEDKGGEDEKREDDDEREEEDNKGTGNIFYRRKNDVRLSRVLRKSLMDTPSIDTN